MDRFRKWTNRRRSELSISSAHEYGTLKGERRPVVNKGDTYEVIEQEQVNLGFVGDDAKSSSSLKTDASTAGRWKTGGEFKADDVNSAPILERLLLLFKYSDGVDKILLLVGSLIAVGTGLCFPLMFFAYADVLSGFVYNGMFITGKYPVRYHRLINDTSKYLDDLLNLDNPFFSRMVDQIYQPELILNRANSRDSEAVFPGIRLSIYNKWLFIN